MSKRAESFEQKYEDFQSALASAHRFSEENLDDLRLDFAKFIKTYSDQFPVFNWRDFLDLEIANDQTEEDRRAGEEHLKIVHAACEEYFGQRFVEPNTEGVKVFCICGATLMGSIVDIALGSTFKWGIAHGRGFCTRCHQGVQMKHYIFDKEFDPDQPLLSFDFPLLYHPSGLILDEEEPGGESRIIVTP